MDPVCALTLSLLCRATSPKPICNPRQPEQSALLNCRQPVDEQYDQQQRIYNRPQYCEKFQFTPAPYKKSTKRDRQEFFQLNCPLG